jgi:C4-dicarboxylate-specific signal transduction histidine kinase
MPNGAFSTTHSRNNGHLFANPYLAALVLVGLAVAATLALQAVYTQRPPLFGFFAAVAAAAWLGGRGPGLLAAGASLPFGLYFYATARPDHGLHGRDILLLVFFGLCAFLGGTLYARRREAEDSLHAAHRALQTKATELQRINDALVAEMAERHRTEVALETTRSDLARAQRLTAMAEMAATVAHEINQPLTAMRTNADTCVRWLTAPEPDLDEALAAARRASREADRAGQVVTRIRAMVKTALAAPIAVPVRTSLDEVLTLLRAEIEKLAVDIHIDLASDLPPIRGDRIQLQQVFANLITNSLESLSQVCDRPRQIWITATSTTGSIALTVRDNGPGFADDIRERLFDSFVTTKSTGMGMGLSICRTIVEAHGGTLTAIPSSPSGAQFTITLPSTRHE